MHLEEQLEKAAYLHDIGKLIRPEEGHNNYTTAGAEFLLPYLPGDDGKAIYHLLIKSDTPDDLISSILHEADQIASGVDIRGKSGKRDALANLFNRFGTEEAGKDTYFPPISMNQYDCPYPSSNELSENIEEPLNYLKEKLAKKDIIQCSLSDLTRILELGFSNVAASNTEEGLSDISFFDHAKLTASIASCLYHYIQEQHPIDGVKWLRNLDGARQQNCFLLVSGDISGVQQFIYTIPSKGALKSLRGRSFYLDILLEHISDEILTTSRLSRSNLLYTGGGHFYLLLPNTKIQTNILNDFSDRINSWFLERYSSRLYLALAWTPSAAKEFMGLTENGAGEPFRRASVKLSRQKLCRYNESQLHNLFTADSAVNRTKDGQRECSICHTSTQKLFPYSDENDVLACTSCRNLYMLGQKMLDCYAFIISSTDYGDGVPLPGYNGELYLYSVKEKEIQEGKQDIVRLYIKNKLYVSFPDAVYLWLADYTFRENGRVLEFSELAARSGGSRDDSGIKRLGVLRADVDNLGAAFLSGFQGKLATLSRIGALSRRLSLFFKRYIQALCAGDLNGTNQLVTTPFSLYGREKATNRKIHVVYSGGDDIFLIGAWDDLIEVAIDINRAFSQYTNAKLTFSAGIGFFPDKCPVAEMARRTGELEDAAKANPDGRKNSLALFGASTEIHGAERVYDEPECFHWDQFTDKVCGEKLSFFRNYFVLPQEEVDIVRLPIGKGGLYRLLDLLDETSGKEAINLARFAYVLARMDPGKNKGKLTDTYKIIREQLYSWYKSAEDRRELRTAIEIIIYMIRDKGEQ